MEKEVWKPIPGYEGLYSVSNCGNVYSHRKERVISPVVSKCGYLQTVLTDHNHKIKTWLVHRLVAIAFIDNPEDKPQVDHLNTDRLDNRVENLRWATAKENFRNPITYKRMVELCRKNYPKIHEIAVRNDFNRKKVLVTWSDGTTELFPSVKAAAKTTGKHYTGLSQILNGKKEQDKGFTAVFVTG